MTHVTAIPRPPAPASRALSAAGLSTLEDVVAAGRAYIADLHGMGPTALGTLDEAVVAAGQGEAEV